MAQYTVGQHIIGNVIGISCGMVILEGACMAFPWLYNVRKGIVFLHMAKGGCVWLFRVPSEPTSVIGEVIETDVRQPFWSEGNEESPTSWIKDLANPVPEEEQVWIFMESVWENY